MAAPAHRTLLAEFAINGLNEADRMGAHRLFQGERILAALCAGRSDPWLLINSVIRRAHHKKR